jgi:hypothetical protein
MMQNIISYKLILIFQSDPISDEETLHVPKRKRLQEKGDNTFQDLYNFDSVQASTSKIRSESSSSTELYEEINTDLNSEVGDMDYDENFVYSDVSNYYIYIFQILCSGDEARGKITSHSLKKFELVDFN